MAAALASWSTLYSNHAGLRTAIEFLHIAGLVVAGGCAITADLAAITASWENRDGRITQFHLLKRTHSLVVVGLVVLTVSGALLLAADVDTYWHSRVFWLKMGLFGLLLTNGALLLRAERRLRGGEQSAWLAMSRTATISLVLWLLATLAGAALPNLG